MNRQEFINYKQSELDLLNKDKLMIKQELDQLNSYKGDFNDIQLDIYDYFIEQLKNINMEINRVNNLTLDLYKLAIEELRAESQIDEIINNK